MYYVTVTYGDPWKYVYNCADIWLYSFQSQIIYMSEGELAADAGPSEDGKRVSGHDFL